ncbi:MAG: hypothetical protein AAF513_04770 [Pseudomonadota bacterium]
MRRIVLKRTWPGRRTVRLVFFLSALVAAIQTVGASVTTEDPLFPSAHNATPLELDLTLPLRQLLRTKEDESEEVVGELTLRGVSAMLISEGRTNFTVRVAPRGKSRRRECRFFPLWLNFKKSQTPDSLFAGQNKIKLVTHCSDKMEPRGYLAAEMLVYRLYNLLNPASFRVRAVNINYVDSANNKSQRHGGFLIEHKKRLGKRLGVIESEATRFRTRETVTPDATLVSLFELMIGNTDFSLLRGPTADECCHNIVPFVTADGVLLPIPYDFDATGLVNPPYAYPAQVLRIKKVTQRLYRGYCAQNELLEAQRARLLGAEAELMALVERFDDLPGLRRDKVRSYLERFFVDLASDKYVQQRIVKRCRQ